MIGAVVGLLRLLLLAALSVGVLGMHTVGHSSHHGAWQSTPDGVSVHGAGEAMTEAAMAATDAAAWLTDAANSCDGTCGTATPVPIRPDSGSDPAPGGTGLIIMCLAVLSAVGVLAVLASALASMYRSVPAATAPPSGRVSRAGPVPDGTITARLVDVAVLRI